MALSKQVPWCIVVSPMLPSTTAAQPTAVSRLQPRASRPELPLPAHRGPGLGVQLAVLRLLALDGGDHVLFGLGDDHVAGDRAQLAKAIDAPQALVEILEEKVGEQYTISAQCCQFRPIPAILGLVTIMRAWPVENAVSRSSFCSGVCAALDLDRVGNQLAEQRLSSSVEHHTTQGSVGLRPTSSADSSQRAGGSRAWWPRGRWRSAWHQGTAGPAPARGHSPRRPCAARWSAAAADSHRRCSRPRSLGRPDTERPGAQPVPERASAAQWRSRSVAADWLSRMK
jgi:hypothetical protein